LVIRPSTTPCKVTLLTNQAFTSSSNVSFPYTPPSACPGPWAKVVFSADFTVPSGTSFDKSAALYVGNATIFRGITGDPLNAVSPSWHVESDVTDLSAIFTTAQAGVAAVSAVADSTATGTVYANAELDFYPTGTGVIAAVVPNAVIPIVLDATNPVQSFTSANPLSVTLTTLPKNMTQLYLDVTTQPDEFWWLAVPDSTTAPYVLASPGTAATDASGFRETDVSIDGSAAGIAPVSPYIFTGGIDPYLWAPITGAQTLNFKPYRINLTPFAGALSDGNSHTITINDINTVGTASVNGDLLIYTDPTAATTTGSVTSNTLTITPPATLAETGSLTNGYGTKQINETLARTFTITGSTTGSAGAVTTTVAETVNFVNAKQLTNSATQDVLVEALTSTVDSTVTTKATSGTTTQTTTQTSHTENPLQATINILKNTDGSFTQQSNVEVKEVNNTTGPGSYTSSASEDIISSDQASVNASFGITSHSGQASMGTYTSIDSEGNNYSSTLTAVNNVLTGVTTNSLSSDSTLFLTATPTSATYGSLVTIGATIVPSNNTAPATGLVTFYVSNNNGNPNVYSVKGLSSYNDVNLDTTTLPVGTDVITASYGGDGNYGEQTSVNSVTVTIAPATGTFTVGPAAPTSLSVSQGKASDLSLPITGSAIFNGTVALTCSGAPSGTTCTINPASVALSVSGSAATETSTVTVLVSTTAPTTTVSALKRPRSGLAGSLGGISIAGILLLCLPKRRGKRWNALAMAALFVLGLGSMTALSGCGGNAPAATTTTTTGGTPTGTYTLTVTGTSGTQTQTATFTLTVTQ
jgi:hypothetical protein